MLKALIDQLQIINYKAIRELQKINENLCSEKDSTTDVNGTRQKDQTQELRGTRLHIGDSVEITNLMPRQQSIRHIKVANLMRLIHIHTANSIIVRRIINDIRKSTG